MSREYPVMQRTVIYAVRRVRVSSTLRFGLVLGVLLTILPSVVLSWLLLQIVHTLRILLEGWQSIHLFNTPLTNQPVLIDFITLLQLQGILEILRSIDAQATLIGILMTLVLIFLGGLLVAVVASCFGLLYNALAHVSGGVVLELEQVDVHPPVLLPEPDSELYRAYHSRDHVRQRDL